MDCAAVRVMENYEKALMNTATKSNATESAFMGS